MGASIKIVLLLFLLKTIVCDEDEAVTSSTLVKRPKVPPNILVYAGKKYYFQTVFAGNFFRAQQFCNRHGMRLVSITSQAENDRLGKYAEEIGQSHSHFWTSGNNLADGNEWFWMETGTPFTYSNWYPGEPNQGSGPNISESCVEARVADKNGFKWNNAPCYKHGHFWTSGTNLADEDEWIWLSTGTPMAYTNWYPGEPNKGSGETAERCVELRSWDQHGYKWNNSPCTSNYHAICELPIGESQDFVSLDR